MLRVVRGDDRRSWGILAGRFRRPIDPGGCWERFGPWWPLDGRAVQPRSHVRHRRRRAGGRRPPARPAPAAGTGFLWPRGRSSRVRPRGAPSRLPARPGVPGTTRYRVSRRSRRTSGTRRPRPPRGLPTRSNNHGPRRTPDTARGIHARRAASQAAPVAPRPGRASASRLTRAAGVPWAAPTLSPDKTVY